MDYTLHFIFTSWDTFEKSINHNTRPVCSWLAFVMLFGVILYRIFFCLGKIKNKCLQMQRPTEPFGSQLSSVCVGVCNALQRFVLDMLSHLIWTVTEEWLSFGEKKEENLVINLFRRNFKLFLSFYRSFTYIYSHVCLCIEMCHMFVCKYKILSNSESRFKHLVTMFQLFLINFSLEHRIKHLVGKKFNNSKRKTANQSTNARTFNLNKNKLNSMSALTNLITRYLKPNFK